MALTSENSYIDLGFAEELAEEWLLTNRYFPSKIGGKAAFLDLENLPDSKDIVCDYCNEPCIFFCQVYAGSEKISHAFHRTIFVFICKNGKCCSINQNGNIKVFRSQLPLKNQFYPDTPPDESIECEAIMPSVSLCQVCGCKGIMICGKCRKVYYCGQSHQKLDWKVHKKSCGSSSNEIKTELNEILFPEYEIVIEREESSTKKNSESEKDAEKRRLREYEEMIKSGNTGGMSDISEKDLQEFSESKEDKLFGKFKKAIESNPTQVLRYSRHGKPLWISSYGVLNAAQVPKCCNCGSKRTFEFQIMPQLLSELKNYDLDYGVIAVYTCEKDCNTNGKYLTEYCYKQDIVKSEDDDVVNDIKMKNMLLSNDSEDDEEEEEEGEDKKPIEKSKNIQMKSKPASKNKKNQPKKAFAESNDWA